MIPIVRQVNNNNTLLILLSELFKNARKITTKYRKDHAMTERGVIGLLKSVWFSRIFISTIACISETSPLLDGMWWGVELNAD